jgi:hypothetical protein
MICQTWHPTILKFLNKQITRFNLILIKIIITIHEVVTGLNIDNFSEIPCHKNVIVLKMHSLNTFPIMNILNNNQINYVQTVVLTKCDRLVANYHKVNISVFFSINSWLCDSIYIRLA